MPDYFPTDVTIEILRRLPVKPLIRFTAVCKSWRSIITGPPFISSHLSIAKTRPTHLLWQYPFDTVPRRYTLLKATGDGISYSRMDFPFKAKCSVVGRSYNGLLCVLEHASHNFPQRITLWNPTVRNSIVLPEVGINPKERHVAMLGFGGVGDDSKIVRLVYFLDANGIDFKPIHPHVEVYSLKKGFWRKLEGVTIMLQSKWPWDEALLNGVAHWLASQPNDNWNDNIARSSILTFNFANDEFGEVLLPAELCKHNSQSMNAYAIEGSLGVVSRRVMGPGVNPADVWIMKEYGSKETWTKLYTIDVDRLKIVVALCNKTEALVTFKDNVLGCYDSESKQVKKLKVSGEAAQNPSSKFMNWVVHGFVESLVMVGGDGVVKEDASSGV